MSQINYHYIAHIVSAVAIVWMISILNNKPKVETVNRAVYDRLKSDSIRLTNERDSVALLLGKSSFALDSISKLPPKKELIYITRTDEINLIQSVNLLDSLRSAIADE